MKLFYRKIGSGSPLIILHGLFGESDNWLSIGRALSADFEVYLVDQRNHGKSPHDEQHNYEVMRDDLLELMNELGMEKATLAGHSMGGKTVMCFAHHYPERIENLIVVDIAPRSYAEFVRNEKNSHYDIMKAMKSVDFSRASSRRDIEGMLADKIPQERIRKFLMKNLGREKDRYFWAINLDVLLRELDNIMDGINEACFSGPVEGFPVLFIRGEKSPYINNDDIEIIKKIFPAAGFKTISGAGHWLHSEKPEEFIKTVKDFIN